MKPAHLLIAIILFISACNVPLDETPPPPTLEPATPLPASPTPEEEACIESGDQNTINAALRNEGDIAVLCQGAVFELTDSVVINAAGQQIYTAGFPTDDRRATLRIVSPTLATAIIMRDFNNAMLSHVIVDGNRPELGYLGGDALIYAGGSSTGQVIRFTKITEPRSWSALHLIQGHPSPNPPCTNALVENNEIGPAGSSNETWADGISLACTNTTVRDNLIVDATDGGIVIFGAPGSTIEGNVIRAETRTLLGGINMVDYNPYDGNYSGTVVRNNIIDAASAVIRIGLGMGTRVWGCLPAVAENDMLYGGTVTGNTLRGANMQYGFAVDGVREWTVIDNVDEATHIGDPSVDCRGRVASAPAGFQYHPQRAEGTFQPEFVSSYVELALWAIVSPRPGE
ncbi:MAG: right-handed parallel beta-helix repeat-containing protein [Anaerolineales bacterium]|nr:right-handed parallel beta-helix repeat-containing protein [Anaerolineales bacterium]